MTTAALTFSDRRAFVCDIIRGARMSWSDWPQSSDDFMAEVDRHHVAPLLAWHLKHSDARRSWPSAVIESLDDNLRDQTVREALIERELTAVLDGLSDAGVPNLLMKGAALAYTVYPSPALRPRNDTDLLIRRRDLDATAAALAGLGYARENVLTGDRVSHQALFRKRDERGLKHDLDVHWKISNRPLFEDVLTWDELGLESIRASRLGPAARTLGTVHALTLACLHPVAHHGNSDIDRIRWVYDVHLLAGRLNGPDFERWVRLVESRQICAIALRGIERARDYFGTAIPDAVMEALRAAPFETSSQYLSANPWRGDVRLSDLRTTPGLSAKARLVREVVLPDASYMRHVYGVSNAALLGPMYVYRLVRGSWKLLERIVQS